MEIRVLLRKGNSLVKTGNTRGAITEFESALRIDPKNERIRKDLQTLKENA